MGRGGTGAALDVGETITLRVGDAYYWEEYSNFSGQFDEEIPVYVQVDSANVDAAYGAVLESHEILGGAYNNIAGPAFSTSGGLSEQVATDGVGLGERPSSRMSDMPARP